MAILFLELKCYVINALRAGEVVERAKKNSNSSKNYKNVMSTRSGAVTFFDFNKLPICRMLI